MATLAVTIPINGNAGAVLRKLASNIEVIAANIPDNNSSGASVVLTVDNAPAGGVVGVQITGGPYQSSSLVV